jgi:hypothetical protein
LGAFFAGRLFDAGILLHEPVLRPTHLEALRTLLQHLAQRVISPRRQMEDPTASLAQQVRVLSDVGFEDAWPVGQTTLHYELSLSQSVERPVDGRELRACCSAWGRALFGT